MPCIRTNVGPGAHGFSAPVAEKHHPPVRWRSLIPRGRVTNQYGPRFSAARLLVVASRTSSLTMFRGCRLRCWGLSVLVLVALLVRLAGTGFGQGALTARPDEEVLRTGAWHALSGDLDPHYAVWGHLFHWLYTLAGAILLAGQLLTGHIENWWHGVAAALEDGSAHFLLGRWLSALFGALNVAAAYWLALGVTRSRLVGLSSALILTFLFLHVRDSHFATCDILLALMCTCALAAVMHWKPWRAGLLAGLALATKLSAAPVLVAAWLALVLRFTAQKWRSRLHALVLYTAAALITWATVQPFLWIDLPQTRYGLFSDLFNPERQPLRSGLHFENLLIIVRYYIPHAMGWPVALLGATGAVWMLVRRPIRPGTVLLLSFAALNFAVLVAVERMFLRYLDPVLPVVAVLAGYACTRVGQMVRACGLRVSLMVLSLLVAMGVSAEGVWRSCQLVRVLRAADTRKLAADWLEGQAQRVGRPVRVIWCGFGQIGAHLTSPWVYPDRTYRDEFLQQWERAGERSELVAAVKEQWDKCRRPSVNVITWDRGLESSCDPVSASEAYRGPVISRSLPALLQHWDEALRRAGVLRPFQPRLFVCRAFLRARVVCNREPDPERDGPADFIAVTFVPWDEDSTRRARALAKRYPVVARFEPGGPHASHAQYDWGDAWWVPNLGLHHVDRPGPWIWILAAEDREVLAGMVTRLRCPRGARGRCEFDDRDRSESSGSRIRKNRSKRPAIGLCYRAQETARDEG